LNITRSQTLIIMASPIFRIAIAIAILVNSGIIGLETYHALLARWSLEMDIPVDALLQRISFWLVALFLLEIAIRFWAMGRDYLRDPWSLFDVVVLGGAFLGEASYLSGLRVLRVLPLLALVSYSGSLKLIVSVMVRAFGGCVAITLLMLMVMYLFAVVGCSLYGASNPDLFGNLHLAMYTLFKTAAAYNLDEVASAVAVYHPGVYWFLLPYFLLVSFVILNLFAGIITFLLYELSFEEIRHGRRQNPAEDQAPATGSEPGSPLLARDLQVLREEIALLRVELSQRKSLMGH